MLGSLVNNIMMIGKEIWSLNVLVNELEFGQKHSAVKIRRYLIDGDELDHEF